jgi:hypothetical protein
MNAVDQTILNIVEWLARRFQWLTGKTNVWLAIQLTNLSIVVYFAWAGAFFWISDTQVRIALGVFCAGVLYVLTQTVFKEPIETYEQSAYHRVAKGLRNPRRIRDMQLRFSFLTLSVLLLSPVVLAYAVLGSRLALLTYSLVVLTTTVLYLLACDPLPPCAGRVRAWLARRALVPTSARSSATES